MIARWIVLCSIVLEVPLPARAHWRDFIPSSFRARTIARLERFQSHLLENPDTISYVASFPAHTSYPAIAVINPQAVPVLRSRIAAKSHLSLRHYESLPAIDDRIEAMANSVAYHTSRMFYELPFRLFHKCSSLSQCLHGHLENRQIIMLEEYLKSSLVRNLQLTDWVWSVAYRAFWQAVIGGPRLWGVSEPTLRSGLVMINGDPASTRIAAWAEAPRNNLFTWPTHRIAGIWHADSFRHRADFSASGQTLSYYLGGPQPRIDPLTPDHLELLISELRHR